MTTTSETPAVVPEKPKKKTSKTMIGCLILVGIAVILAISIGTCLGGDSGVAELSASVRFDGAQFIIKNNNDYSWHDVQFTLNSDYKLTASLIEANTEYTVGAMQFAKSDGTRFNPFTQKVIHMFIYAETSDGHIVSNGYDW